MIDLRSDTVTRPSEGMRAAMAKADVGDDVFGDDPTVNALQEEVAAQFGFEAGLFFPTGTQCNLAALMSHCQRGDEYLVAQQAHTFVHEGGGAAVLGSLQPQPLPNAPDGSIALDVLEAAIKPDDIHYARTRLLTLENTFNGRVLPLRYTTSALALAKRRGLATHLDGARVFNAATKLGCDVRTLADGFDSVSVCLSKGLGAPMGSVLVGARTLVVQARRWRKMLGGGSRQVGLIAAAGRYALSHNVARLQDDHDNAAALGAALANLPNVSVEPVETNMVWLSVPRPLVESLKVHGVLATGGTRMRLVTHLDFQARDIERVVAAFRSCLQ